MYVNKHFDVLFVSCISWSTPLMFSKLSIKFHECKGCRHWYQKKESTWTNRDDETQKINRLGVWHDVV